MLYFLSSFIAMTISFSLRVKDRSDERYAFLAYCWVMVEPPCVISWPRTSAQSARRMPVQEMPDSE